MKSQDTAFDRSNKGGGGGDGGNGSENRSEDAGEHSDMFIFSGGMPRSSFGEKQTVSVMHGKRHVVFDVSSKVLDFEVVVKHGGEEKEEEEEEEVIGEWVCVGGLVCARRGGGLVRVRGHRLLGLCLYIVPTLIAYSHHFHQHPKPPTTPQSHIHLPHPQNLILTSPILTTLSKFPFSPPHPPPPQLC